MIKKTKNKEQLHSLPCSYPDLFYNWLASVCLPTAGFTQAVVTKTVSEEQLCNVGAAAAIRVPEEGI